MDKIEKVFSKFVSIIENIVCFITVLMVVSVFVNALMRYVFGKSFIWNEEFARYLFIWCCFLGGIVAHQRHQHLNVTIIMDTLPPIGKKIFMVLSRVITTGIVVFLFYSSLKFVQRTIDYNATSLPIRLGILNGVVSIMCFFMLLIDLYELIRFIGKLVKGEPVLIAKSEKGD